MSALPRRTVANMSPLSSACLSVSTFLRVKPREFLNAFLLIFLYLEMSLIFVDIVTDLINALPGNRSVNKVQHAKIDEAVFSMSSTPRPLLFTDQLTRSLIRDTCFLCGLRHATIMELCFLRCPCRGYITRVRGVEYLHRDPASRRRRRKGKSQI
jgi:hypothetical protein